MDNSKPEVRKTIFDVTSDNPQVYQCALCEPNDDGSYTMPEIISPCKIYSCIKCNRNYSSQRKLEKHKHKNLCQLLDQEDLVVTHALLLALSKSN